VVGFGRGNLPNVSRASCNNANRTVLVLLTSACSGPQRPALVVQGGSLGGGLRPPPAQAPQTGGWGAHWLTDWGGKEGAAMQEVVFCFLGRATNPSAALLLMSTAP
jgi:hypothetical protein